MAEKLRKALEVIAGLAEKKRALEKETANLAISKLIDDSVSKKELLDFCSEEKDYGYGRKEEFRTNPFLQKLSRFHKRADLDNKIRLEEWMGTVIDEVPGGSYGSQGSFLMALEESGLFEEMAYRDAKNRDLRNKIRKEMGLREIKEW